MKKDRDKKLIKKWHPISLLNADDKLISKALVNRVQKIMTFDSVNRFFLISVLKGYSFGYDFIKWIKTLLNNQERLT